MRALVLVVVAGCATDPQVGDPGFERDAALDVDNRSTHGEDRSHHTGENCMQCHQAHGPGLGLFTIAGSVFGADGRPVSNPTIDLYDGPADMGGQIVAHLDGDTQGNVFTTDPMPFPDTPLYPVVKSQNATLINHMPFGVTSGACNLCHRPDLRIQVLPP